MKRPGLVFAALLIVALIVLLPLRLALMAGGADDAGVAARSVSGSLWSGGMADAAWRGVKIGDGSVHLSPTGLFRGRLAFDWQGEKLVATMVRQGGGGGIEAATGRIGPVAIAGLGLRQVDFDAFGVMFEAGRCIASTGRVTVQPEGALAMAGAMSGAPRCEGDAMLLPLVSGDSMVQMTLRLRADAGFQAVINVEPVAEALRPALQAAGFQPSPQGMTMTVEGVL
jgi:general secretion pathway protein N